MKDENEIIMLRKNIQNMNILDKYNYITSLQVSDIKDNALYWLFDEVYFYIFGSNLNGCSKCHDTKLELLKTKGKKLIMNKLEVEKRTCKPNFKGLRYIGGQFHGHYLAETLTDKQAIEMLKSGYLKESDFDILPLGYMETEIKETVSDSFTFEPEKKTKKHK